MDPFAGRRPPPMVVAAVVWGVALAVVVARDGSWVWTLVRVAVVGLLCAGLVTVVRGTGRGSGIAPLVAGIVGVVVGIGIGLSHLLRGGDVLLIVAGLAALVAGLVLVVGGARRMLRSRGRWARIGGGVGITIGIAGVALIAAPAVMATNVPPLPLGDETPAERGIEFADVTFESADGVQLAGWYVASTNGAAVVLRHGAGSTRSDTLAHLEVLSRHGYGVLATDARGHGESGGRAMDFGWYGDDDITGAVDFLVGRPDVEPDRIGVVGMSMGGEEAIGAAGADQRIRVVVAEGATARTASDHGWLSDVYGAQGVVQQGIERLRFGLTDLLTAASPPGSLAGAVERSSAAFLVIAAGRVPDEGHVAELLRSTSPDTVTTWEVPDADHTDGLEVVPDEWERRVVDALDRALLAADN